jgi:NIPSNAP
MPAPLVVVELRQYTLRGGRRDELIDLFEREFVAPQDALGAYVLGTFRDRDDADRFVWLRAFDGMESRARALESFYDGPVWGAHKRTANATMLDSDNVLLLRPVRGAPVPPWYARDDAPGVLRVSIHNLRAVDPAAFADFFERAMRPGIERAGASVLARLQTETAENTFPRLPVREGESVFVWLAAFPDPAAEREFGARLAAERGWRDDVPEAVLPALMSRPEVVRLEPVRAPLA